MILVNISVQSLASEGSNSIISITIATYQCALIQGNSHDHVSISHVQSLAIVCK